MKIRDINHKLGFASALLLSACASSPKLENLIDSNPEEDLELLLIQMRAQSSGGEVDNGLPKNEVLPINYEPIKTYDLMGSVPVNHQIIDTNYVDTKTQNLISQTTANLEEDEKPGSSEAKRIAFTLIAGELSPDLGAAVSLGYAQVDRVNGYRRDVQNFLYDNTGLKFGFSISGNALDQPRVGVVIKRKANVLGTLGTFSLDLRERSSSDAFGDTTLSLENYSERELLRIQEARNNSFLLGGGERESMTLTFSYTIKF